MPVDARPTGAGVTPARSNRPGPTVDRTEEAERESLRLRCE
ncbi:hypothetical protein [Streptomyces prasinosporus]